MNHRDLRHLHAGSRRYVIGGFVAFFGGLAFLFLSASGPCSC